MSLQFWKCQSVNYGTDDPKALTILKYTYLTFLLKLVELVETVFFVLRKKQSQVSKLHVYHHVSTATLCWIMVKYAGGKIYKYKFLIFIINYIFFYFIQGGMILFSIILNSFVHVIMYSYYFAALFGPTVQKKLEVIKKNVTLIQMVSDWCAIETWSCDNNSFSTDSILFDIVAVCHWNGTELRCAQSIGCHLCTKYCAYILYVLRFL